MDELDPKSAGTSIWFHFGGSTDKLVKDLSLGCQVIAGDKYWDADKNEVVKYQKPEYKNGNRQGAYNDFLRIVKSGIANNNTIKYNLIHNRNIKQKTYNQYSGLLH